MPAASDRDPGARLMAGWIAGDEGAFDRLVELYAPRVWALLTRFLGRHPAREDLVQEVFLRVVRSRERYEATARFTTWLYTIVFNLAVNETQRGSPRQALPLQAPGEDRGQGPGELADPSVESPSRGLERADAVAAVRAAIASLPEHQRLALVLAKYEELSHAEIAAVLGSTEKAIKSLIHRARETLRARLAPFLEEEPA